MVKSHVRSIWLFEMSVDNLFGIALFQILTTDFQLEIVWNKKTDVMVTVPQAYWNRTCGLCGTFNGDKHDDFILPDGSLVSDLI